MAWTSCCRGVLKKHSVFNQYGLLDMLQSWRPWFTAKNGSQSVLSDFDCSDAAATSSELNSPIEWNRSVGEEWMWQGDYASFAESWWENVFIYQGWEMCGRFQISPNKTTGGVTIPLIHDYRWCSNPKNKTRGRFATDARIFNGKNQGFISFQGGSSVFKGNIGFISFQGEKPGSHQFSMGKTMVSSVFNGKKTRVSSVFKGKNYGFISFQGEKTGFHQFSRGKTMASSLFNGKKPGFHQFSMGKDRVSSVFNGKNH